MQAANSSENRKPFGCSTWGWPSAHCAGEEGGGFSSGMHLEGGERRIERDSLRLGLEEKGEGPLT